MQKLGKAEIRHMWDQQTANTKLLDACVGPHVFVKTDDKPFLAEHACTLCGGVAGTLAVAWYERGLMHARLRG